MATYKLYSDPSHGWLKVKLSVLSTLGIVGDITSFSYIRGEYAYLEEDQDVDTFLNAVKRYSVKKGIINNPTIKSMKPAKNYSRIRSYEPYCHELAKQTLLNKYNQKGTI